VLGGLVVRQLNEKIHASISALRIKNLTMGLSGALLTILLVYFLIARMVVNPVKMLKNQADAIANGDLTRRLTLKSRDELADLADSFSRMAEYLNKTIGIVEDSAMQLAEGASEQASAVEETSSSIEEISSMMKKNTENSNEGNKLMSTTEQILAEGNVSMKALASSLQETSAASDNIGKIIKTIQEIAFQTNLLALNAAVEAARAGEAGSGFAVVAEEVRNLAIRSAEAAQNTEKLIEDIVHKIKNGTDLVQKTDDKYREGVLVHAK
jgi:methyl-accepting chemotaxis protein